MVGRVPTHQLLEAGPRGFARVCLNRSHGGIDRIRPTLSPGDVPIGVVPVAGDP